jgi:hypothetical protein
MPAISKLFDPADCCNQRGGHYGTDPFTLCQLLIRRTLGKEALHEGVGASYPLVQRHQFLIQLAHDFPTQRDQRVLLGFDDPGKLRALVPGFRPRKTSQHETARTG